VNAGMKQADDEEHVERSVLVVVEEPVDCPDFVERLA
jgi:hypothetical protein